LSLWELGDGEWLKVVRLQPDRRGRPTQGVRQLSLTL
jgi:hypothetical protein